MVALFRQLLAAILAFSIAIPARANANVTSYSYDGNGNRTQKVSTLPGYPGGLTNYNANDQLATDTYDANGNTTASGSTGYVYDFENHLISANGITYVYDGDGHRISKTVNGTTTTFATSDLNPTGYSQVLGESYSGNINVFSSESQHSYFYGLDAVLELRDHYVNQNILEQQMYFVHDGHGSVRAITDQNGNVTDTYDYDAFGVLTHQTGTTPNTTLFAGEQFDPDLHLYYNRARYLNASSGRFWNRDAYEGLSTEPQSLHSYLYASADPIDRVDPTGMYSQKFGYDVEDEVQRQYSNDFYAGDPAPAGVSYGGWARVGQPSRSSPYALKPDIFDRNRLVWAEVKPLSLSGIASAGTAWSLYNTELGAFGYNPEIE
jgi:RHS repeat-associated protein